MNASSNHASLGQSHTDQVQVVQRNDTNPDSAYFSSPLASPIEETSMPPFGSDKERLPTLGVYFSAEEGETNDVIAALRVCQRVIKETAEMVLEARPRTDQLRGLGTTLHDQERDFMQWIYSGLGIDQSRRLTIRSMVLYKKLASYVNSLRDLQGNLPLSHQNKRASMIRRLSTSTPRSDSSGSTGVLTMENPRIAMDVRNINKRFDELKKDVGAFSASEKQRRATWDIMQRTLTDLRIHHSLCLPGTRQDTITFVNQWAQSEEDNASRILCIIGGAGSGKSSLATTIAVNWKREGMLETPIFLSKLSTTPQEHVNNGEHKTTPLTRALSNSFGRLRRLSFRRPRSHSSTSELLNTILQKPVVEGAKKMFIVVDGLDHVTDGDSQKIGSQLKEILAKHSNIRLLLTSSSSSSQWLESLSPITFHNLPAPLDPSNIADMFTYVSSRLSLVLSEADRQRVVEASEGDWRDVVRICDEVEELGNPERALDGVLYREVLRRHPGEHVKVVLV